VVVEVAFTSNLKLSLTFPAKLSLFALNKKPVFKAFIKELME
tara:strand:- start:13448 stop:13573 length:126 start_codon:yes stop_codon:yes gene_type:complete